MNRKTLKGWIVNAENAASAATTDTDKARYAGMVQAYNEILEWEEWASAYIAAKLPEEYTQAPRAKVRVRTQASA